MIALNRKNGSRTGKSPKFGARNAEDILESLSSFAMDGGAVLMVTHDERAAQRADRSIRMEKGEILQAHA